MPLLQSLEVKLPPCPEDQMGGGVGGERSIVLEHATVVCVDDVEVAAGVQRDSRRIAEAVRGHAVVVAVAGSEAALLPEYQIGGPSDAREGTASSERVIVFEHAAVVLVGDVEVAAGVHRNP